MKTQLLVPLPKKAYKVMKPFIDLQLAKIKADTNLPVSKNWETRPDNWDHATTRFSKGIATGRQRIDRAYAAVASHPSGAIIQRQLLVHDFFGQINVHGPEAFLRDWGPTGDPWKLSNKEEQRRFKLWKEGKTGYDIVDAAMLELRDEGFVCNRLRMLLASYLSKNLLVNWQLGEKFFASVLEDYGDGASNMGNWMWVSGAGFNTRLTDVLNPEIQAAKVDPDKTLRAKHDSKLKGDKPEFDYQSTKQIWLRKVS